MTGSYDPDLNLTYWGTGNPSPDWNSDARPGDNLYSDSVIALDADTGKLRWHYQFTPHDDFDFDAVQVPVLADIEWQGRKRKVILWANRNGFFTYLIARQDNSSWENHSSRSPGPVDSMKGQTLASRGPDSQP